ncbi:13463_t:CDS:2, partial [Racocetra fulgida]
MQDVQSNNTSDIWLDEPSDNVGNGNDISVEAHKGNVKSENISSIHKPPTNEEIQGLKETSDLYKSNLFKLQIDELLSEVSIDFSKTASLENTLHKLKEIFENINDKPDLSIAEVKSMLLKKHGITIPFPDPQPSDDVKYQFGFKKPAAFYLVGSYPLKSVVRNFSALNFVIRILPCIPMDVFSPQRLSPSRNNIRPQHFQNLGQIPQQQSIDSLPPTPQYNSAILKDMHCVSHLNLLYKNSKDCPAFNDACKLAKVWLHQRGIGGDEDGWRKKLANGYSSYQLVKGTMDFLARIAMEYFNENEADRFEALFLQKVNDTKLRYDNVA